MKTSKLFGYLTEYSENMALTFTLMLWLLLEPNMFLELSLLQMAHLVS